MTWLLGMVSGGKAKWIAVALAALAVVFYIGWLKLESAGLRAEVAQLSGDLQVARQNLQIAVETNRENEAALKRLKEDARASEFAIASYLQEIETLRRRTAPTRREVSHVAATQPSTCPISPSVRAALDGLRGRPGAAGGDQDRAGSGRPADGTSPVRP